MGRPSNREEKRRAILQAFAQVLADHGYAGATVAKVAAEAGVAPGLIHNHFKNKEELLGSLLDMLMGRFRSRLRDQEAQGGGLTAYADAALKLDEKSPRHESVELRPGKHVGSPATPTPCRNQSPRLPARS